MEHLSPEDAPPQGGPPGPPPVPQLPPQMFTTAAQLLDLTDKKLMVALRDGRKLIGVLRSWDQFANLVLQDTIERIYAQKPKLYADIERGVYLVRGENVLLLGEIDLDREDSIPKPWKRAEPHEVHGICKQEEANQKKKEKAHKAKLQAYGFEGEHGGEAII